MFHTSYIHLVSSKNFALPRCSLERLNLGQFSYVAVQTLRTQNLQLKTVQPVKR